MSNQEGISIEQYVLGWGEKLLNSKFSDEEAENKRIAADYLFGLVKRIAQKGEREDIQTPFRELRDIITEVYYTNDSEKGNKIKLLFQMYQGVFDRLTPAIFAGAKAGDMSICPDELAIMEELRLRFYKLVAGETWKDSPDLRLIALRYMCRFMDEGQQLRHKLAELRGITIKEQDYKQKYEKPSPTNQRKFGIRSFSAKVSGPQKDTWENTFEDLVHMSSERMFPLIRILLEHPDIGKLQQLSPELEMPKITTDQLQVQAVQLDEINSENVNRQSNKDSDDELEIKETASTNKEVEESHAQPDSGEQENEKEKGTIFVREALDEEDFALHPDEEEEKWEKF